MKLTSLSLVAAALFLNVTVASASPKQSMRMIHSHNYNISNSIGAIENNFNIKETFFVDSKSICRHLGIVKSSIDAVEITLKADSDLKRTVSQTMVESKLGQMKALVSQTTSYCGHNYASEGKFDSSLEANNDFMKNQLALLGNTLQSYDVETSKAEACVNKGSCQ